MSASPREPQAGIGGKSALAGESIGFLEVLFQSLTYVSPGTSLALVLPFVVAFSGGALPLVVIFIFVGCICTAWLLGEMAGKLPSSGGMLTFISNGLGPNIGFMAGWIYVLCLLADVAGIFLLLAGFVSAQLHASWGWNTTVVWVIVAIALAAFVTLNGLRKASRGTLLGSILGTIEVLVFAILSVWLIFSAGGRNTLQVFTTHYANAPGYHGISGIVAAAVLTILAYQGFESACVLGEEAKQPLLRRGQGPVPREMGDDPIGRACLERAGVFDLRRVGRVFPGEHNLVDLIDGLGLRSEAAKSLAQGLFDHFGEEIRETRRAIAPMLMRARVGGGGRPMEGDAHQIIADRLGEEVAKGGVVRRVGCGMRNVKQSFRRFPRHMKGRAFGRRKNQAVQDFDVV